MKNLHMKCTSVTLKAIFAPDIQVCPANQTSLLITNFHIYIPQTILK